MEVVGKSVCDGGEEEIRIFQGKKNSALQRNFFYSLMSFVTLVMPSFLIFIKYVPFARFNAVDIPLNYQNRKETTIYIEFQYRLKNVDDYQTIKRIIL